MPARTERQLAMDALEAAYAVSQVLEAEAMLVDSDTNSSSSGSSSSSSSDEEMQPSRSETILDDMADLYSRHYLNERRDIPKTQDNLHLLLHTYKDDFPDIFRSYVRVSPTCFDSLVDAISADPIFHNNSPVAEQLPITQQLAITLYRFGHYGNAASTLGCSVGWCRVWDRQPRNKAGHDSYLS